MPEKKVGVVLEKEEEASSSNTNSSNNVRIRVWYGVCLKNQAARVGKYAVDGCLEFMASDAEGTEGAMICDACGCNRNFHKTMVRSEDV